MKAVIGGMTPGVAAFAVWMVTAFAPRPVLAHGSTGDGTIGGSAPLIMLTGIALYILFLYVTGRQKKD